MCTVEISLEKLFSNGEWIHYEIKLFFTVYSRKSFLTYYCSHIYQPLTRFTHTWYYVQRDSVRKWLNKLKIQFSSRKSKIVKLHLNYSTYLLFTARYVYLIEYCLNREPELNLIYEFFTLKKYLLNIQSNVIFINYRQY